MECGVPYVFPWFSWAFILWPCPRWICGPFYWWPGLALWGCLRKASVAQSKELTQRCQTLSHSHFWEFIPWTYCLDMAQLVLLWKWRIQWRETVLEQSGCHVIGRKNDRTEMSQVIFNAFQFSKHSLRAKCKAMWGNQSCIIPGLCSLGCKVLGKK